MKRNSPLFILLLLLGGIVACTKSSVNTKLQPTYFRLTNAYPGNTYSMQVNQNALFNSIPFDSTTEYALGAPGVYNLFITDGSTGDTILNSYQAMQSGQRYTLFVIPDSAVGSFIAKTTLITDNHDLPLYDSAKLRFLNFSPNAPSVNIEQYYRQGSSNSFIKMNVPIFWRGRTYLDNSIDSRVAQYVTLKTNNYRFVFASSNDTTQQVLPPLDLKVEKDKFYTVYLEGFANSTNADSLKMKVMISD